MYKVIFRPTDRIVYEVIEVDPSDPDPGVMYSTREEAEADVRSFQEQQDKYAADRKPR